MKFLVVDDLQENREAAEEFFSSQNIEVDFASSFETGLEKLDNQIELYYGAIFDLQLPYQNGDESTDEFGFKLAKKAQNYGLPCVVLTAGIYHHGPTSVVLDEDEVELAYGPSKDTPQAYRVAYDTLLKLCPGGEETLKEIFESRKRYKERVGRQYQRRPTN